MSKNIFVWGSNQQTANRIAKEFDGFGDNVYIGSKDIETQNIKNIDILLMMVDEKAENDGAIGTGRNYEDILNVTMQNVLGAKRCFEAVFPLLELGEDKRIVVITKKASSVTTSQETENFAYHMSLISINKMLKAKLNAHRKDGFTFRCLAEDDGTGMSIRDYVVMNFCHPGGDEMNSDEDRLVMRNRDFVQIPW